MSEPRPFQVLEDRLAGKPVDTVLLPGVPEHLVAPLETWITIALNNIGNLAFAEDVVISLQWPLGRATPEDALMSPPLDRLLAVVDAMLQVNVEYGVVHGSQIGRLEEILRRGRSAYRVADDGAGLVWRVDPTVEQAFRQTTAAAPDTASDLLRQAWHHLYKPEPDPTSAYRDAVRAVEAAFVPVVSPRNERASLGTVCRDLGNQQATWELVLVDTSGAPTGIASLVGLLGQLWQGQRSRHAGGSTSREQTLEEATAAVHLAVLAVQWLTVGALRRTP